jgi:hypothetical protein
MTTPDPPPTGTLHSLAIHLAHAVQPLEDAFRTPQKFITLMFELGWEVDGLPPEYVTLADQVVTAGAALEALDADPSVPDVLTVISKVGDVYRGISALTTAPGGVDPAVFLPDIGRRLFEYLLARELLSEAPGWFGTLNSLGVIRFEDTPAAAGHPAFTRWRFDWDQIPAIFSDPNLIPQRLYGWGTPDFAFNRLVPPLLPLLHAIGLPVTLDIVGPDLSNALQSGATAPPAARVRQAITLPLFDLPINGTYQEIGFMLAALPAEGPALPGMILQILAPDGLTETVDLGGDWTFALRAGTDLAEQLAVVIRPRETSVRYPFAPGQPLPSAGLGMSMVYKGTTPKLLFGQPSKTRLELGSASLDLGVDERAGQVEVTAGATVDGLTFVLNTADMDSFLSGALGGGDLKIPLQLGISWSSRTGLTFLAGAGFTVSLYPHVDLGVLRFDRVDLAVRLIAGPAMPELDIAVVVSFSGEIGPVSYAVDQIGAQLTTDFTDGNAGPFNLDLTPVWPTGLGLGIDAGPIQGGGFISYDQANGRYVGILQLELFYIGVTATGLLDTKDANGVDLPSPGYSFVLIISAHIAPIQLGYGFTLNAVGGIAALNRRLDSAAVLAGIRQGGLQKVLFPADPVRDANAIVTSLSAIFPIAMGRYVFGPTAVIGWGTPTLVTVDVAIVIEVPAPIVLTILGEASVVLPDAKSPIVELHIDVIGVFDPGQRTIAIDASLHDSKVAGFSLSGDFALRLAYGDNPAFALAVGGFNPHFDPPAGFPTLRRVTIALGADDNPRVSIEGYHAITTNSRQFGAKAELYAAAGGFNVHGWLSFDALIVMYPFSFRFDFSISMSLNHGSSRIAGVTVNGTLTGPNPFHVWGSASLSLLFFDISVPFDATFGLSSALADLVPLDPWPLLQAAIGLLDNWAGEITPRRSVSLARSTAGAGPVDPIGTATLRQKVLPLARALDLFGQYAIAGPDTFTVKHVTLGSHVDTPFVPVSDYFVPGDFEKLSATDQISRDSFEQMTAGITVDNGVKVAADATKVAPVGYQTKIIDSSWQVRTLPVFPLTITAQLAATASGAVATRSAGRSRFARADGRVAGVVMDREVYVVASTDTLSAQPVAGATAAAGLTKGAALSALRRSGLTGLQVVPVHETEPHS